MKNVFKYVFLGYIALLLNGELYAHSYNVFLMSTLILMYITLIIILDILIKKFNFNLIKIFLTGSLVGLLLETFYSKSIFVNPLFLGVNWLSVIIQFIYWGMALTLPFYVYNKIYNFNKKYIFLDFAIVIYILIELIFAITIQPPNVIIWILTGVPLGLITIYFILKNENNIILK